jgi:hypothetical protein
MVFQGRMGLPNVLAHLGVCVGYIHTFDSISFEERTTALCQERWHISVLARTRHDD